MLFRSTESRKAQIDLPDGAAELIQQYETASEQLSAITEQQRLAENLLKEMLGENEVRIIGKNVVTWKSISQERLDSKTLKSENPELYQKYATTTNYRRFSVKTTD